MKIAISIGHTIIGQGTGAVGQLNESKENRIVGNKLANYLRSQGHTVDIIEIVERLMVNGKQEKDFVTRAKLANQKDYDLLVEIHFNDAIPTGHGTEVYYKSEKGKIFAEKIVNSISALGYRNRGAKYRDDLYILNSTKAVAVLVECCFVNSNEDFTRYNPDKMALAIATGITSQIGSAVKTSMTYNEAIEVIKNNYPSSNYTLLRDAIDLAIKTMQEKIK